MLDRIDLLNIHVQHTKEDIICPYCTTGNNYSTHKALGQIMVNNEMRQVYGCSSCTRIFDYLPNYLKQYLDQVKSYTGADGVVYHNPNEAQDQTDLINKLENVEMNTDQIKNSLCNIDNNSEDFEIKQQLEYLNNNMTSFMTELRTLLEQQNEALTDPMRGIREALNNFNLK